MNITATQLKQQINVLNHLKEEEIVVTKRDKPFAVIVDFDKYNTLVSEAKGKSIVKKLEVLKSLSSFSLGGKDFREIKGEME